MLSQGSVYETGICLSVTLFALLAVAFAENITISLPPVMHHGPPPHHLYNAGKTVNLQCQANGLPPPKYEWYRNGEILEETSPFSFHSSPSGNNILRISTSPDQRKVETDVDGRFQCKAHNDGGTAMSNVSKLQAAVFKRVHRRERNESRVEGNYLKLPCDHVISVPNATIQWVTVGCSRGCGDEQTITLDDRISIDQNGSLVFSHVLQSDGAGGRVYKCIAFNPVRRKHIGGSYTRVIVQSGYTQNRVPTLLYSSASPMLGLEGENVTLTCFFSAIPTPHVQWSKEIGTEHVPIKHLLSTGEHVAPPTAASVGEKTMADNHTHHMHLVDVTPLHSGYYECQAENSAGKSTITRIKLNVEAAPVIELGPVDQNVTMGTRVTFRCKTYGIPSPTIQWYRNDQLLYSSNLTSHWSVNEDNNKLTIEVTRLADTCTIHCNVTNKHGSSLEGAYLLVYEPPIVPTTSHPTTAETTTEAVTEAVTTETTPDTIVTTEDISNIINNMPVKVEIETPVISDPFNNKQSQNSAKSASSKSEDSKPFHLRLIEIVIPVGFLVIIVMAIIIAIIVFKCKRRKRTYKVDEREQKLGRSDGYDSDDSGYLDDRPANQLVHHIREEEAPGESVLLEAVV